MESQNLTMRLLTYTLILAFGALLEAQTDPGPRGGGPPLSGQPIRGLTIDQLQAFGQARDTFNEIDDVVNGLGPRFNLDGCGGCHAHPNIGGSSPAFNPQPMVGMKFGAHNQIPEFIQPDGPIRVVRFRRAPDGTPDGGVHNLFVISGRSDAPAGCQITQPDFSNTNNLSFRIPTPTFGLGLIEAIPDSTLRANLNRGRALGIQGRFNTSGNDGTITRYGWKAQNKSLLMFSGEAYNVEMGVTNNLFPQEREENPICAAITAPEDQGDIETFTTFMRFLAPPMPSPSNASIDKGRALFDSTGCAACHTPVLRTGNSTFAALSNQDVHLYSDLATHRMGQLLNDGITQGQAQGQDWRTAPLWGLGDRIFLLHDGRTQDLMEAIRQHDSQGSEAHNVIQAFQALMPTQKQDLLNFLRSL
jgi:CxxC motif-containing protein (DUF1111 family)